MKTASSRTVLVLDPIECAKVGSPETAHILCAEALKHHPNGMVPLQSVYDMLLTLIGRQDVTDAMRADGDRLMDEGRRREGFDNT